MGIKLKLIISFIGLAIIGLTIGAVTLFNSYISTTTIQSRHHLQDIISLVDKDTVAQNKFPKDTTVSRQRGDGVFINLANPQNIDLNDFFSGSNTPNEDSLKINDSIYVWQTKSIPGTTERIILLRPVEDQTLADFIEHYGAEFAIFNIFTIWSVIWVALVVSALITKVNEQKLLLEKQHEKALHDTKAKSQFLAHISHEIRTPLSAIIGYSETLLHSDQPMIERLSSINTIIRNGHHMLNLVNDLLDLSKIEADKLELESIDTNLFVLLHDIEQIFQHQCKSKGIEFKIKYHFPLPETINSDPIRLKQILINLCSNAVKFTKAGYVYLDVQQDAQQRLHFMIEDSGVGMTEEQLSRIFRAYTQATSSTSREYGGTGLGLSLSKHLARLLGGDISVSSHAGRGSNFTLTINACNSANSRILSKLSDFDITTNTPESNMDHSQLSGKVLIAEDNQDNQKLFTMYMKKFGIEPDIAHNGQQAVELALSNEYNLIFMDMQMPIMDGIEATTSLRRKGMTVPIIALTANAMKEDMDRFFTAGCDDFITKPLKREKLFQICSKYLQSVDSQITMEPITSSVLEEDPDFIDIITRFCDRLPETIQNLYSFLQQDAFDELGKQIHDLKGVSGNMGYLEISDLAGRIEFQIAKKDRKEIEYLISKLQDLHNRVLLGLPPALTSA